MREKGQRLPTARTNGLIVHELSDEVLIYDQETHKAHCLNRTAALIWRCCDGSSTVEDIRERLEKKLDNPVEQTIVMLGINQLDKARLLSSSLSSGIDRGVSRRQVLQKLSVGAVAALPLITSIISPHAVEAATCQKTGKPCIRPRDCCSEICGPDNRCL